MIAALLTNLALVLLFALGSLGLSRVIRRPALVHGLWLVVLLRLFVPPLLEVGFLPSNSTKESVPRVTNMAEATMPISEIAVAKEGSAGAEASLERQRWFPSWMQVLFGVWALGSLLLLLLSAYRTRRFRRVVALSEPAGSELQGRTAELAKRMNLEHAPTVRLVEGNFPPLVWNWAGQQKLILPERLLPRLEPQELDAILLHELAHIRRKDHLVRIVELLSGILFWWYPVVWWVHRRLRHYEELSCDAWVVKMLPKSRKAYADALVKTLETINGYAPVPDLACGIGHLKPIEERLTMIMKKKNMDNWSGLQKWFLALAAVLVLAVFPTWAEPPQAGQTGSGSVDRELRQIEEQSRALQSQLHELEIRREEIHWLREQAEMEEQISSLREEGARLRSAGNAQDAEWAESRMQVLAGRLDLQQQIREVRLEGEGRRQELVTNLKELSIQAERLAAQGKKAETEDLMRDLKQRKEETARELQAFESSLRELHTQLRELEIEAAEQKIERLRYLGQDKEADAMREELEARQKKFTYREQEMEAEVRYREMQAVKQEFAEMKRHYEHLVSEGKTEQAEQMKKALMARREAYEAKRVQEKASAVKLRKIKEKPPKN